MSDSTLPTKILIIDADRSVGQGMKAPLEKQNVKVDLAADLSTGLYLFQQNIYPVVLIELAFEELPGLVLIQRWRQHENPDKRNTAFVLLSGNRASDNMREKKLIDELEDLELLYKPVNPIQLLPILARAMQTRGRRLKYGEIAGRVMQLASRPETVAAAIDLVKSNMKELGPRGQDLLREVHEAQLKWDKALDVVDGMLTSKPDNLSAVNHKGRLLLKLGRNQEALKYMELADKQAPQNIQRINEMAIAYLKTNHPDLSIEKMKEVIKYHPDQPEIKFDLFAKLQEYGFDQHAVNLCKDTTGPLEVVRHYNNKGVALAKAGNVEGAIMEYERALLFFPKYKENYRILYNIAMAHLSYKTRGHYEIAMDYIGKCLELNKSFDKALKTREQITEQLAKKGKSAS